ncbi:hypothetical protein ACOME3_008087 [Neoechinorhynchus agilis]
MCHFPRFLLSGGVDSTVCCQLIQKAIGKNNVYGIHIDHGFMRQNETQRSCIYQMFPNEIKDHLIVLNKFQTFMEASTTGTDSLMMTTDPEEKRHIIGDTFIRVVTETLTELSLRLFGEGEWHENIMLAQGTLRPDLIESASPIASSSAITIKTHHNDSPLVRILREAGRVIEPLKNFHKNEIRIMARDLGIDDRVVYRHPFPGPGLAIRIICSDHFGHSNEQEFKATSSIVSDLFSYNDEHAAKSLAWSLEKLLDFRKHAFQFTEFTLPLRSVGVQGDTRSYGYVVALCIRSGKDIINRVFELWESIEYLTEILIASVQSVNRVVVVLTEHERLPPKIDTTRINSRTIDVLRKCDNVVNECLCQKPSKIIHFRIKNT